MTLAKNWYRTDPRILRELGLHPTRIVIAVLALGLTLAAMAGCKRDPGSQSDPPKEPAENRAALRGATGAPTEGQCPPAPVPMLSPTAERVGHHRVLLHWNAPASASDPKLESVGYCLYRSEIKGAAKQYPRCPDCEQVNIVPVPFTTTRCMDNVVEDGAMYYYVVTAMASNGVLSPSSNEAPAHIQGPPQPPPTDYPLCRTPVPQPSISPAASPAAKPAARPDH